MTSNDDQSLSATAARARRLLATLDGLYPDAVCTLDYDADPWRLLVGGILAAQCTDARVNRITPALYERYPDMAAIATASESELEPLIRSCGMYRTKARHLVGAARHLLREHDGVVPQTLEELVAIPGVGRKIANLILGDAFGQQAVVVDTHCARVSRRMGLTDSEQPARIERDLMAVLPEDSWTRWGHLVVAHGRELCTARRTLCEDCPCRPDCRHGSGT
ncbi:MAG: endonuclease III [Bacillota bacterium]|nr:endonuclease III [Bacillota bacterium]